MYVQFHPISEITYKLRHGVFFLEKGHVSLKQLGSSGGL